jgi:Cytochrome b-c1 complex subunit 8
MAPGAVKGYMPHLMKVWKAYVFTSGQKTQMLSPYEINVIGSLFKDVGGKVKHKVVDNFWDVAPGLLTGVGTLFFVKSQRKAYLYHHRA